MKITKILESPKMQQYLEKRNLLDQYRKAKRHILQGRFHLADLKKRQPKDLNVWYFRINQQFRAKGFIQNNTLFIIKIDNHQ